jgi:uncharacterized membrane protein
LPWAIASTVLFGVATYVLGWSAKEAGFLASMWFARGTVSIVVVVAAFVVWVRSNPRGAVPVRRSPSALRLAAFGGVVELLGTMVYARGAEVGLVSIVTAASATYPFIPVLGGVVLLHERMVPNQYVGVALVVAGLMLLALG